KSQIEIATVVFTATGKTSYRATHASDTRQLLTTIRTAIDEPRCVSSRGKRQSVTALAVAIAKVHTGLPPLAAVRQNPLPASAKLGKNMRQLMPQSSIDFVRVLD